MAAVQQKVPVDSSAIETIATKSHSKPTRRSTRNVAQKSGDEPGAGVDTTEKRGGGENEVSGPGRETIPPATLQVPNREERSPAEKEGANGGGVAKRGKGGDGARRKKGKSNEEVPKKEDDSIRCFCQSKVEKGEMVCCDACSGWFHLKCMGMKEGAEVMKEKEFVCHFCVSSTILSMREEISGLRRELENVKSEMKKVVEQNELGQKHVGPEGAERRLDQRTGNSKQSEVMSDMQVGEERNTVTYQCRNREAEKNERSRGTGGVAHAVGDGKVPTQEHSGETEKQAAKMEIRAQGGNQENTRKSKQPVKQMIGARKVWGTRKGVTCDEVAKAMVRIAGKLPTGFSVMKRMASVNGKKKWWFIVKAPERSLQCVDKAWNHKFWQWQRVLGSSGVSPSYFLGLAPVSTRHR